MKIINCHAGALPFYRGRNCLNWVLINDEKSFGITVHYVDEKIDTGDIILQEHYEITDSDDYATLLKRAYKQCAIILCDSLKIIQNPLSPEPLKQSTIHPMGFYCVQRKEGDEIINWNQTSREIFNFIRSVCNPGPMAKSFIDKEEIRINKSNIIERASLFKGITGSVIGTNRDSFLVKTLDSFIRVTEWRYKRKIKIGDRLR